MLHTASTLTLVALLGCCPTFAADPPPALEKAVVDVIARAEKSVVAIARVRRDPAGETAALEVRPDPFGRRPSGPSLPNPTDPDFVPNEYGAGVIVDSGGLILTTNRFLADDSDFYVTTSDRRVYRAEIKAADPRSDLAVLSISAQDVAAFSYGAAENLHKGDFVVVLGNPHGIARDGQASAALGMVANLGRKAPLAGDEIDSASKRTLHQFGTLLQIDARSQQGASGGAVVNLRGELVGLTVSFASAASYEPAAGYAIPIDATFRRVIDALKQGREVEYGFLGVRPTSLRSADVFEGKHGVPVQNVVPGSPAERYGLHSGDVILAVGGKPIYGGDDLMLEVGRLPVESTARFTLLRGRRTLGVDVVVAKYPVQGKKVVTVRPPDWRGLRVDYQSAAPDLPGPVVTRVSLSAEGVWASEVQEGKAAWKGGLRPGMVIVAVDGTPVRNPREFAQAVAAKKGAVSLRLVSSEGGAEEAVRTVPPE